jgi:hypothetical protein
MGTYPCFGELMIFAGFGDHLQYPHRVYEGRPA